MSNTGYQIVQLASGVNSVRSLAEKETFHPVIGPVAEAEALYVKQLQLIERVRQQPGAFVVWDVGLGAGANALTVLRATRRIPCSIRLLSFDHTVEPLIFALHHKTALGYFDGYEEPCQELIRRQQVTFKDQNQMLSCLIRFRRHEIPPCGDNLYLPPSSACSIQPNPALCLLIRAARCCE